MQGQEVEIQNKALIVEAWRAQFQKDWDENVERFKGYVREEGGKGNILSKNWYQEVFRICQHILPYEYHGDNGETKGVTFRWYFMRKGGVELEGLRLYMNSFSDCRRYSRWGFDYENFFKTLPRSRKNLEANILRPVHLIFDYLAEKERNLSDEELIEVWEDLFNYESSEHNNMELILKYRGV